MDLEDLEVYKQARAFRNSISKLTRQFPEYEKFELTKQIKRASRSISANIAEGYGRFHYQENIQFCRQGRGSLYECIDHLNCAFDEAYINEEILKIHKDQILNLLKLLNGFIGYLKKQKQGIDPWHIK